MQLYLKWAVFISAVGIVVRLIMFVAGISLDPSMAWVQWIGMIIAIGLIYMGVRERKSEDPENFTFGAGWVATFMICAIAGVISALWVFVDASYIETDMIDVARKAQETAMLARNMTREQVDQAMGMASFFLSPSGFAVTTVFSYLIGGALLGLIMSPIVKALGNNSASAPQDPATSGM